MLDDAPLPKLPARDPRGHKGIFGTVLVVGGRAGPDTRMIGAPALVASAALRAGAGLARIAAPDPVLSAAIVLCPAATGVPIPCDAQGHILPHEVTRVIDEQIDACRALVVGPGLGPGEGTQAAALRAIQQETAPTVIDADGLSALAEIPDLTRDFRAAAVLTPHPGEFRRLASALRINHDPVDTSSRPQAAAELSQRLGCITVLKGAGTIVSDGQRTWVNTTGSPVLATGGTGDILAGVIAGLIAQHHPKLSLYDLARLAVHAHGRAAELWSKERSATAGLLAPELGHYLPAALEQLRAAQ